MTHAFCNIHRLLVTPVWIGNYFLVNVSPITFTLDIHNLLCYNNLTHIAYISAKQRLSAR